MIRYIFISVLMAGCLISCWPLEDFSDVPHISLNKVSFRDSPNSFDTLLLSIDFQDGDGDLGMDQADIASPPFNDIAFLSYFEDQRRVVRFAPDTLNESEQYTYFENIITFSRRSLPDLDTLPGFVSPYNCKNWLIGKNSEQLVEDTIYIEPNRYHNNIYVEFYLQQNDGSYALYDWENIYPYPDCGGGVSYNGKFPRMLEDPGNERPIEGTLEYRIQGFGFNALFGLKRLKLRCYIFDRAHNMSNIIETSTFTLAEITE